MSNKNLAAVTNELIESYGNTAKNVINAYRVGNERAISYVDQSWAAAVKKTGTRLNADIRSNAVAAQKKVTSVYAQGVVLATDGAELAVNRAVELAGKGVEQVSANATRFEKRTGVAALNTLAQAAVPAAQAVTKLAAKLEAQSGELANKVAGSQAKVKVAAVKRTVVKKAAAVTKTVAKVAKAAPKAKAKVATKAKAQVAKVVKAVKAAPAAASAAIA
jgi:hypothetical protein